MLKNRNAKVGYKQRMYELEITGVRSCHSAILQLQKILGFKGITLLGYRKRNHEPDVSQ